MAVQYFIGQRKAKSQIHTDRFNQHASPQIAKHLAREIYTEDPYFDWSSWRVFALDEKGRQLNSWRIKHYI